MEVAGQQAGLETIGSRHTAMVKFEIKYIYFRNHWFDM